MKYDNHIIQEHSFPFESFIGGWYLPDLLSDNLKDIFNLNRNLAKPGKINPNTKGIGTTVDKSIKDSLDMGISPDFEEPPFNFYRDFLDKFVKLYEEKYPEINKLARFNIVNNYTLRCYPINGGYKDWHYERSENHSIKRQFAFMTYLNNVEDGGTEFKYQKLIVPAKKGLTIIWPSDWTHTHRGQISNTKEKYVITGWLEIV